MKREPLQIGDRFIRNDKTYVVEGVVKDARNYCVREYCRKVPLDSWIWNADVLEDELAMGFIVLIRNNGLTKLLEIYKSSKTKT